MNELATLAIREKAEKIMERLNGARIYGEPIDLLNPEHILCAAYYMGEWDRPFGEPLEMP